ncbi:MAG: phytanoyl-CoA dioxygenase family protein [Candidatus Handelsmanbacteria bacterium]|nr:phytanoyl-CoA dioxygenase family protein [Candidatus Handelsmanbacteria bacterium]
MQTMERQAPVLETITTAHLAQFQEQGYLAFEGVLDPAEVEAAAAALSELTLGLIEAAHQGKAEVISSGANATQNYSGPRIQPPGSPCFVHFESGVDPLALDPAQAELKVRKLHGYHREHPFFTALVQHPRIKGVIEALLGQQALLFGEMALSKPPFIGSEKPWHQDNAYFVYAPLELVATAWIALDDATAENGCMYAIPGGHRAGAFRHVHGIDCQIAAGRLDLDQCVPVELKAGGGMFFSGMLPHQTPPNRSPRRRRALQFQYRGVHTRALTKEEYSRVFVEADGTPASCAVAERVSG